MILPGPAVRRGLACAGLFLLAGCARSGVLVCTAQPGQPLPRELEETSGAAWSHRDPGIFWTHNDGRGGTLYAVDTTGSVVARVETRGERLRDVEDLATGPCGEEWCLYMADTGDNGERRQVVAIHRLREPEPVDGVVERERFRVRFPGGPRDVESLVVLPGERILLVSKGRSEPVTVYRYPGALTSDSVVVLERVAPLADRPPSFTSRVSGGSAIPGREDLVLIRSYTRLILVDLGNGGAALHPDGELNLRPLEEIQGEAVAVRDDGRVVLTSEAGPLQPVPGMHLLQCTFPTPGVEAR